MKSTAQSEAIPSVQAIVQKPPEIVSRVSDSPSVPTITSEKAAATRKRAARHDKGTPRLTDRDLTALHWIAQQYAIRFDQLQNLLGKDPRGVIKEPGKLSPSSTRSAIQRWQRLGLVQYRKIFAGKEEPGWIWLSSAGLRHLETGFTYYEPKPGAFAHLHAINQVRLFLEWHGENYIWKSERQINKERGLSISRQAKMPHRPDGEVTAPDGTLVAIEVERTDKKLSRLIAIMQELVDLYPATWYFAATAAQTVLINAATTLPERQQKQFRFFPLEKYL